MNTRRRAAIGASERKAREDEKNANLEFAEDS